MKNILWKYFINPNMALSSIMSRHISELARGVGMAEKKKYGDVEFNEQQMEEFRLVAKKTHFLFCQIFHECCLPLLRKTLFWEFCVRRQ